MFENSQIASMIMIKKKLVASSPLINFRGEALESFVYNHFKTRTVIVPIYLRTSIIGLLLQIYLSFRLHK